MVTRSPRKQRKMVLKAPMHLRGRHMSARLSPSLSEKYGARAIPVRKGDKVIIERGDYAGHQGEVVSVDRKAYRIIVEGANIEKTDGTERSYPIHPSNVVITEADMRDEMRKKSVEKKGR
ncbi:MAG: 50S ribosomal protein L24 [Candidatus Methanofastidiosa archaeon]|nr:50S ribosomal protein L24 [Candidatus Methanofastidiosa archaeon]MDD4280622.1 50S ribosomal protein L24 [Candidatus Methanofastidiosa archaeon]